MWFVSGFSRFFDDRSLVPCLGRVDVLLMATRNPVKLTSLRLVGLLNQGFLIRKLLWIPWFFHGMQGVVQVHIKPHHLKGIPCTFCFIETFVVLTASLTESLKLSILQGSSNYSVNW